MKINKIILPFLFKKDCSYKAYVLSFKMKCRGVRLFHLFILNNGIIKVEASIMLEETFSGGVELWQIKQI